MKQIQVKILKNERIADGFYRMRVASSFLAMKAKPGQFVEVRCSAGTDPLLRRPLGIHRIVKGGIELLYEVVGRGTELLSYMKPGSELDVIGPLGSGFTIDRQTGKQANRQTIIVAGGNGVAPLLSLAESLAYSVERIAYREKQKIQVLIGAKTKSHIICDKEFKKLGCEVLITTEDGSYGKKGLVTDSLSGILRNTQYAIRNTQIYACGPTGMLKAVAEIARGNRIPCQVSLEERMACGVGVCLGCPVRVKTLHASRSTLNEYKMVCKDGPVFNAEEIAW